MSKNGMADSTSAMTCEAIKLLDWLRVAQSVAAFCGAGVSAESGLPTFRGAGGLWEGTPVEEVATPKAFARDPARVWSFYAWRQESAAAAAPNAAHVTLARMEQIYERFLVITQNVDNLHERAGSRHLVKLHGNLMELRCPGCETLTPLEAPVSSAVVAAGELPRCPCGSVVRPNVVWFGETIEPQSIQRIAAFLRARLDLMLVVGTSGLVSGGYGIVAAARAAGARLVEINPEPTALSAAADLCVRAPAGALFHRLWPALAGHHPRASSRHRPR
jgi:NAD-dependent deacetylase